jgi:UDP-N-acetylglucosamine 2-epimerase (non-hydrolysing)
MANAVNPYGDGLAAPRSVAAVEALFGLGTRMADFIPFDEEI